jgi:hypothetical protein
MPYNTSINKNILDWKKYEFDQPTLNDRNLFILSVNTSEAVLLGTEHSFEDTGYVTTRF